jgi:hypothetical protein
VEERREGRRWRWRRGGRGGGGGGGEEGGEEDVTRYSSISQTELTCGGNHVQKQRNTPPSCVCCAEHRNRETEKHKTNQLKSKLKSF